MKETITMRTLGRCLIFIFLNCSILHAQTGQMEQLGGPNGGPSEAMTVDSNGVVYLLTSSGFYKRPPSATGWLRLPTLQFAPAGGLTCAAPLWSAFGKLFLNAVGGTATSSDEGTTWTVAPNTWPACPGDVVVAGNKFYSVAQDGIYRSTDTGKTWQMLLRDTNFAFQRLSGGIGGKFYATGNGIYTNISGDSVWRLIQLDSNVNMWDNVLQVDSATCIIEPAQGYPDSTFRTTNAGLTWHKLPGEFGYFPITKDSNGDLWKVLLGYDDSLMLSHNLGASWINTYFHNLSDSRGWGDPPTDIIAGPNGEIYIRTSQHIYRYSRNDSDWLPWDDSLRIEDIYSILPLSSDSILVLRPDGFCLTNDRGKTWTSDSLSRYAGMDVGGGNMYRLNLQRDRQGYIYSRNLRCAPGTHGWQTLMYSKGSYNQPAMVLAVDSDGYLYSDSSSELLRSSDHGDSWKGVLDCHERWNYLTVDARGRMLAAVSWNGWPYKASIIRSDDHGETWDTLYQNPWRWWPTDLIYSILSSPSGRIIAICHGYDSLGAYFTVIESPDDGLTWQIFNQNIDASDASCLAADGDSTIYVAGVVNGSYCGIIKSTDGGKGWSEIAHSPVTAPVSAWNCVAVGPGHQLYAGSADYGVFRYVEPPATVSDIMQVVSQGLTASMHVGSMPYIECRLPSITEPSRLTVYDVLGRIVTQQTVLPGTAELTIPLENSRSPAFFIEIVGSSVLRTRVDRIVD